MTNNLNIDAVRLRKKLTPQNLIDYRVYYIGKDGIRVDGTPIESKFPWRIAGRVVRGVLRAWAGDLVAGHDAPQLTAILHRWSKQWLWENDVNSAYPAVANFSTLECLLSWLREQNYNRKVYFQRHNNDKDASTMYYLSEEMLAAVSYCLKRMGMKPKIQWIIESLPNDAGIYRILLEGGDHCEG